MKRYVLLFLTLGAIFFLIVLIQKNFGVPDESSWQDIPQGSKVQTSFFAEGKTYHVIDGDIYEVNNDKKIKFVVNLYDPEFYEKNYVEQGNKIFRKNPNDSTLIPVRHHFEENFEGVNSVLDLINLDRGWTGITLQSPLAKTVEEYVKLRQCIVARTCTFKDNRAEIATDVVHSGQHSLEFFSVPPTRDMVTAKASLDTELIHFTKGDHVWFSSWYYLEKGRPTTIMDLESTWLYQYGGIRIAMNEKRELYTELKFGHKPIWLQQASEKTVFPLHQWVNVKVHFVLDEENGVIEVWQDSKKIIDGRGQTLPLADTVYNSFEMGISANPHGETTTLYVDDIVVSRQILN